MRANRRYPKIRIRAFWSLHFPMETMPDLEGCDPSDRDSSKASSTSPLASILIH
jgi:hypothetical protein